MNEKQGRETQQNGRQKKVKTKKIQEKKNRRGKKKKMYDGNGRIRKKMTKNREETK